MKYINIFFKKRKKIYFYDILKNLNIKSKKSYKNALINDIQNLDEADKNDITFFHTLKYKDLLKVTKSNFIITTSQLSYLLPKQKIKLIVDNVLISVAKITEYFYPDSLNDQFENECINIDKKKIKYTKIVLKSLNPIISKYVEENSITIVFPKKSIVVAKKNLDITISIMDLLNNQLKKIDF